MKKKKILDTFIIHFFEVDSGKLMISSFLLNDNKSKILVWTRQPRKKMPIHMEFSIATLICG